MLIVAELALSVVLLVGFGLVIRSLVVPLRQRRRLRPRPASRDRVRWRARIHSSARPHGDAALERARALAGVESVALASRPPLHGARLQSFGTRRHADSFRAAGASCRRHSHQWRLLPRDRHSAPSGRPFTEQDTWAWPPVVIVSETLARQLFPGKIRIGRRDPLQRTFPDTCCVAAGPVDNVWREIVGVVGDIRQANLDEKPAATMYGPYTTDLRTRHVS